jgi:hypothetical protein
MTATEAFNLTTHGGAKDFATLVGVVDSIGPWCLIGGLAVNCYVEPVYTLDADLVVIATELSNVSERLREEGFKIESHPYSVNATAPESDLRIQFTTDPRYQDFPARARPGTVLGVPVRIATLEDVTQGKLWAYSDPLRRFSKRKKDELDLVRLAEAYPRLKSLYPADLRDMIDRG